MGKTTVANMFRRHGVPVHDSDAAVHALYAGVAAPLIEARFPGTVHGQIVDRNLLAQRVFGDDSALAQLEAIVHPLIFRHRSEFLKSQKALGRSLVVLDIPLLLEVKAQSEVDFIAVVSSTPEVQKQRVLSRPGMSEARFAQILAKQMPDSEKRRLADFVINTNGSLVETEKQVVEVLRHCQDSQTES